MSAHLRSIVQKCQSCGQRRATVQVFNTRNAPMGVYCKACGGRVLRGQLEPEAAIAKAEGHEREKS